MNRSRPLFITLRSTRIIGSKPTTAGSSPGCDPCADSSVTNRCEWSCAVTRSCITCGAATTNSGSRTRVHRRVAAAFTELARTV
jgi:hypothetical protein